MTFERDTELGLQVWSLVGKDRDGEMGRRCESVKHRVHPESVFLEPLLHPWHPQGGLQDVKTEIGVGGCHSIVRFPQYEVPLLTPTILLLLTLPRPWVLTTVGR